MTSPFLVPRVFVPFGFPAVAAERNRFVLARSLVAVQLAIGHSPMTSSSAVLFDSLLWDCFVCPEAKISVFSLRE